MLVPPVKLGGNQVNAKVDFDLSEWFSLRFVGVSGLVVIIAPFPLCETMEFP
jgi:hypothetical protein